MTIPFQIFLILACIVVFFTMPWLPWGVTAMVTAVGLVAYLVENLDNTK